MSSATSDGPETEHASLGTAALALLLEQMPDAGLCLLDSAGVIEMWHASAEALFGHIASQVQGQRLETLLPEERRFEADLPRALFEASARGRARFEAALMTRTGQRRLCSIDLTPRTDAADDVIGFIVLLRATGPRRAADAVNANENLLAAHRLNLTRASDEPAWIGIDMAARIAGLAESAARWMGCDVEDTLGRGIQACVELRDEPAWPVVLHRAVRSGEPISLAVRPVGAAADMPTRTARVLPLRGADGRLNGFTLLIDAGDAVRSAEPTGGESRLGLDRASDRAGVLAAAHDLREPLRKMQHNARQLEASEAPRMSESGRQQLAALRGAADRMQHMIGGMLRLARIDTGTGTIERHDLNTLIDEVRDDLALLIEEHQVRFELKPLGAIRGDGAQLRALFQNLIDNSIRYRRPDEAPVIRIEADLEHTGSGIKIVYYQDNARGIGSPEQAFQPFRRDAGSAHADGTGIGLSLCRRICRRHGGDLRIERTDETGTRFILELRDLPEQGSAAHD
ncbi:PAS/PAC sensor signal transduction histidine kinase [Salinisphaera sp. S4-8]|uniref:sensor histidine kinase n=1 Tax=Salinisphaera sp. S4-8 TaxID=633357 RepID=UPI00333F4747